MECGDADLAKVLQKRKGKPLDENFIRLYWQQMLQAVQTIHEKKIIHSDLKPANFLVVQGTVKLIDFGISMAIQSEHTSILRDNPVSFSLQTSYFLTCFEPPFPFCLFQAGTINYMSPEALLDASPALPGGGAQRRCTKVHTFFVFAHLSLFPLTSLPSLKIGRPSDVWSLGCLLYQMVYGAPPFASIQGDLPKLQAIVNVKHDIPFPPIVNPALLDTMKKCLLRNPTERPTIPALLEHDFLYPQRVLAANIDSVTFRKSDLEAIVTQALSTSGGNMETLRGDLLRKLLIQ